MNGTRAKREVYILGRGAPPTRLSHTLGWQWSRDVKEVKAKLLGDAPGFRFLPDDELGEVLRHGKAETQDLFIAGLVDATTKTVLLVRGDLTEIVVPLSAFAAPPTGAGPDFSRLAIGDYGQTIQFGEYEAAADAILYEFDADYRRRLRKKRLEEERTFGVSLRRLRLQRRLTRDDFAPLSEKTIARIERGETPKPHEKTLALLAKRLRVKPQEIAEY